ncbi:hypothetical protein [Robertkochia solimangrovi]|uniref:hypothetical protein n=1 Tax=Robertkochia solimangrovi TaxID=2213046 RepID=UPI00117D4231|nr:hypothetical protein [Robertkochia solimangrovi]TRZ42210.1 hypothetical protein DMZ48_14365 [Robertkochia solimangrovi]
MRIILLIFILSTTISFSQNDYYQLVKNGTKFKKPIYYILENIMDTIIHTADGKQIFLIQKERFEYDPNIHFKGKVVDSINYRNRITANIQTLYNREEEEYLTKARIIKNDLGFKPIPPLTHKLLKLFILKQKEASLYIYEVNWISE